MYTCVDWLALHGLSASQVQGAIYACYTEDLEIPPPSHSLFHSRVAVADQAHLVGALKSQCECYNDIIIPALVVAFANKSEIEHLLFNNVEHQSLNSRDVIPHTVDKGLGNSPTILMNWSGRVEDLMCLAHETAHALQILLSNHETMPPVGRETCAFIGELLLLDYVKVHLPNLHPALVDVWYSENDFYLGSCVDALEDSLNHTDISYHYYKNYPLARLAAMQMYCSGQKDWLFTFLSSGRDAMAYLPIDALAKSAGDIKNSFPPLSQSNAELSAVDAYRSLGVMALLDISYGQNEFKAYIDDYYLELLKHLENRTAFIALDNERKPVGYATWIRLDVANNVTLTRQTALLGKRFNLQRALEKHVSMMEGVKVSYTRNASQEMLVW
ncbi:hypothetical protein GCM10007160_39380 [Litchfieldella qijiaojingensis]|uniref:Uncharacterized protein n=1 Tax=Litchfieldella qijiaojingensis TaxID=980347 RepID=A0ABQ2Z886_9GAMM|nr:hypothetical protein [Halomonas qijiaojingensis]GGY08139.1 hypothetical protein GCM10007160_39380 [Halomonas qijiaojingensis]